MRFTIKKLLVITGFVSFIVVACLSYSGFYGELSSLSLELERSGQIYELYMFQKSENGGLLLLTSAASDLEVKNSDVWVMGRRFKIPIDKLRIVDCTEDDQSMYVVDTVGPQADIVFAVANRSNPSPDVIFDSALAILNESKGGRPQ